MEGKSQRKIGFAKSLTLTESENRFISKIIGDRNESLCTVVIQLFDNDVSQNSWELQLSGVLCLIKDYNKRSYYFRLFYQENGQMIWEHELFPDLHLKFEQDYFITFELENSVFGLNFRDTEEAISFYDETNKIIRKIAKKSQPAEPIPMKFNIKTNEDYENLKKKKNKKDKKKKISRQDIGAPQNFVHVAGEYQGEKMGRPMIPIPENQPVSKIQQRPLPSPPQNLRNSASSVSTRRSSELNVNVNLMHQNSYSSDIYETVDSPEYLPPRSMFPQPDNNKPKPPKSVADPDDDTNEYLPMDGHSRPKPIQPLPPKVMPAKTKSTANKPVPQIPQQKTPKKLPPNPVDSNGPEIPSRKHTEKKPIPQPFSNRNSPYKEAIEPPSFKRSLPISPANRFDRSPSRGIGQFDTKKDEPASPVPNTGNFVDQLKNFQLKKTINTPNVEGAERKLPGPAKKPLESHPGNRFDRSPSRGIRQFDTRKDEPALPLPDTGNFVDQLKNFQLKKTVNTPNVEVAERKKRTIEPPSLPNPPVNRFEPRGIRQFDTKKDEPASPIPDTGNFVDQMKNFQLKKTVNTPNVEVAERKKRTIEPPSLPKPAVNRFEPRGIRQFNTKKDEPASPIPDTGNFTDQLKNFQLKKTVNTPHAEVTERKLPGPAKKPLVSQPGNLFKQNINCFENSGANGHSTPPQVENVRPSGIIRENSVPTSSGSNDFLAQIRQGINLRKVDSTKAIAPVQSKENNIATSLIKAINDRRTVIESESDDSDSDSDEQEWSS